MSFIMRQVAHCDVCGHEWLTAKVPSHCAKCKSRKWNQYADDPRVYREDAESVLQVIFPNGFPAIVKRRLLEMCGA